ncbi:hypothetical protein Syun_022553 [Stephania yunnanensis]|uniref:Uncharacterized protein n=1 Tax=Stephania yunnanensis TaxID=152371 RepID=A0AAP0I1L4_9MAGN
MATNKFATMLHKNTHRISVVLIHAVLEWILIVLLLLNSLFSYLITKFAKHFGLQPPCPWCSRLDKFFDPSKPDTSYRDLICEVHAAEISRLGFCSRHGKLAETHDMCEECSPPASEANSNGNSARAGGSFDFFSWVEEMGKISNDGKKNKERVHENGERSSRCSCCEVSLNAKMYTPYWLFKPSWEVVDYIKKENPVEEAPDPPRKSIYLKNHCKNALEIIQDDEDEDEEEEEEEEEEDEEEEEEESEVSEEHKIRPDVDECVHVNDSEECSESPIGHQCEKSETDGDGMLDNVEEDDLTLLVKGRNSFRSSRSVMTQLCSTDNVSLEMLPAHLEKWSDHDDHFLVTIESIDSMASEKHDSPEHKKLKNELKEESKPADKVPKLVESADDLSIVLEMETENQCSSKHQSKSRSIELIEEPKSYAENENSSAMYAEDSDDASRFVWKLKIKLVALKKLKACLRRMILAVSPMR